MPQLGKLLGDVLDDEDAEGVGAKSFLKGLE
jgi:hypothetical protein